jgi:hypothetical protein
MEGREGPHGGGRLCVFRMATEGLGEGGLVRASRRMWVMGPILFSGMIPG